MARRAGAEYGGTAFPAFPVGRGLVVSWLSPLQLVGEILEMVLEARNLMVLDDNNLQRNSLVAEILEGCRGRAVSGVRVLYDGDLLPVLDTCMGVGSL